MREHSSCLVRRSISASLPYSAGVAGNGPALAHIPISWKLHLCNSQAAETGGGAGKALWLHKLDQVTPRLHLAHRQDVAAPCSRLVVIL